MLSITRTGRTSLSAVALASLVLLLPVLASANVIGGPSVGLQNPLGNITIQQFFTRIIDIILVFAIPIIVFFIILAGFTYVTAGGNEAKVHKATHMLTWCVIGGLIIIGAKAILVLIENTVSSLR